MASGNDNIVRCLLDVECAWERDQTCGYLVRPEVDVDVMFDRKLGGVGDSDTFRRVSGIP